MDESKQNEPELPKQDGQPQPQVPPGASPVDQAAQEEAGKDRKESGGYN